MQLGDWQPLALPDASTPLRLASREHAIAVYEILVGEAPARCEGLQRLALTNQVHIASVARSVDAGTLGQWLHTTLPILGADHPICHGLAIDVALWLGQGLITAACNLKWHLLVSHKKSTGYQRAVLTGFTKVEDAHYYVDVAHFVATWIDYAARRRAAKPTFLSQVYDTTLSDA
jgi:hypothetical protein